MGKVGKVRDVFSMGQGRDVEEEGVEGRGGMRVEGRGGVPKNSSRPLSLT